MIQLAIPSPAVHWNKDGAIISPDLTLWLVEESEKQELHFPT